MALKSKIEGPVLANSPPDPVDNPENILLFVANPNKEGVAVFCFSY